VYDGFVRTPRWVPSVSRAACVVCVFGCGGTADDTDGSTAASTSLTAADDGLSTDAGDTSGGDGGMRLDTAQDPTAGTGETGMACNQDVDIVFVMDVSTTMGTFIDELALEISVVDAALQSLNLPSPPQYGLVVFVDDVLIMNAGAPYTDIDQLRADFEMWSTFTASNQQVQGGGFNSTWPENSLDALYLAGSVFQWRPVESTLRLVIHTTDDTFWEGPGNFNAVDVAHSYDETVDALRANEARVFTFGALIGGQCDCEDVSPGWSTPYMGKTAIPDATGGGWWNIDEVLANVVSLSASIDAAVTGTMCTPYPPAD
jgi:hypothetical protein